MFFRQAELKDIPQLVEMAAQAAEELNTPAINREAYAEQAKICIQATSLVLSLVADTGEEIIGICQIALLPAPWDISSFIGQETHWYLKPEYRKGMTAIRMFKHAEKWAFSNGAKHIVAGLLDSSDKRAEDYLKRIGYTIFGKQFIKEF